MQEQALGNTAQVQMEGDKAVLVLERQPPLHKTKLVQMVNQDEVYNYKRALVLPLSCLEDHTFVPDERSLDLGQGRALVSGSQKNGLC